MPRDLTRRSVGPVLRHRASSPASVLCAFSALVVVSVAISSGLPPEAGVEPRSAFGMAAAGEPSSGWTLLAAGSDRPWPPAAPRHGGRSTSPVRDGAEGDGGWREGAGRGDRGRRPASTVRPGRQAPRLYEGELPVNTLIAPTSPGVVLSGGEFGWRIAPDRGGREFHNGTDVSADAGLPVVAALDGVVSDVFWDVWGGNRVEVSHANGLRTTYNHLEDVRVRVGDRLAAAEELGSVGATGTRVTGPHLHFETWVDGRAVDPQSFDWIDGFRIIPASRAKYSLEVLVPDDVSAADPAPEPVSEAGQKKTERKQTEDEEPTRTTRAPGDSGGPDSGGEDKGEGEDKSEDKSEVEPERRPAPGSAPAAEPPAAPAPEPVPVPVPDAQRDLDGDGVLDIADPDLDGDSLRNEADGDLDGDGTPNAADGDLDGDGLLNDPDPDADGDGRPDAEDARPSAPDPMFLPRPEPSPAESPSPAGGGAPAPPPVQIPSPTPVPAPDPTPAPSPLQGSPPAPNGAPAPAPVPVPSLAPAPSTSPAQGGTPASAPRLGPSSAPAPDRGPVPTASPAPGRAPAPTASPAQAPDPDPTPAPTAAAATAPAP